MAVLAPTTSAPTRLGRFELRRVLGKGAQATVWLGFDPRLQREVAVKLMRAVPGADAVAVDHWLREARSVSRLNHPHIVPVFEADTHDGRPYLVFEYVAGHTLADLLRSRGPLPAREAAQMMIGVLDAFSAAHAAGVVHRDLKPSNILVEEGGRARVMDFGIAASVKEAGPDQQVVGTPGYMSPEAVHGAAPSPAMDVFSAGLVLAETLSGRPLIAEKDAYRAIYRVAHEDLALPDGLAADVDDALRAIVARAIARDPSMRYPSAAKFSEALQDWLTPMVVATAPSESNRSATLEFLLRRMKHKSDFPALSDAMASIQRLANSDKESLGSLSNEILKDVALTNKLLRLVNTASYRHAGGGTISTVSRAVALVGFAGIRNMALSLVLLEHMNDKTHAGQIKEEFLRSLMAGSVASELSRVSRESEEAFIGAMLRNLGRLLTQFYFPEEARQVRAVLADHVKAGRAVTPVVEESASVAVLGISYEELAVGVAKSWGLPEGLQRCMRTPSVEVPGRAADQPGERVRWLAVAANEITDALMHADPAEASASMAKVAERYARALAIDEDDVRRAASHAQHRLVEMAQAMSLQVAPGTPASRLLRGRDEAAPRTDAPDTLTPLELHATMPAPLDAPPGGTAAEVMAAGIQDITNSMVENFRLNEVLRMILETMFRALAFRRVVFCLRDARSETLVGRFGLGADVERVAASFRIPLRGANDLFSAVCLKGADTLISDASAPNIAARLPEWYRQGANAPAFLLLPLMLKGAPIAMIYADKARAGAIEIDEKELSLLRTLRNQAVMAFKQAG
jgi:serine/threonine protein kinase